MSGFTNVFLVRNLINGQLIWYNYRVPMIFEKYFRKTLAKAFEEAEEFIANKIVNYASTIDGGVKILDVGCGVGDKTEKLISKLNQNKILGIYGLDILPPDEIRLKSIIYKKLDIENEVYPFEENTFDIVICNQVIEHLLNKDFLLEEVYRVLRKGGFFILATENIASIDNIFSLILGQEPVTQVTSSKYRTNSILSAQYMQKELNGNKYEHKNVNSYFGIKRIFRVNGFEDINLKTYGNVNKLFEILLPIYNRIMVVTSVKKG